MNQVDLFLGGPLGLWVLGNVDPGEVGTVFSRDENILMRAAALGIPTQQGHGVRIGLSMHYPLLLSPETLAQYDRVYNIHPAFLPWGRCYYPVFWALWAGERRR